MNSDDYEYFCESCERVRFPRYIYAKNEKVDLAEALSHLSKTEVSVAEEGLAEFTSEVHYSVITYTFAKSGPDWLLKDVEETGKVWEDADQDEISDGIQLLREESPVDFYFCSE